MRDSATRLVVLVAVGLLWPGPAGAEGAAGGSRVWVYFRDRGTPVAGARAPAVTPRSLERRLRRGGGIVVGDEQDRPVHGSYVERVAQTGAAIRHRSRYLNAVSVVANEDQIVAIGALECVERVARVARYRRPIEGPAVERGEPYARHEGAASSGDDYGASRRQVDQINVIPLHDDGYRGEGVLVAVLDTGFNLSHEVFDSLQVVAQWDFIFDDSVTSNEAEDPPFPSQHSHGTNVLSVLAGHAPGRLIGPAWKAGFVLAKTERMFEEVQGEEDDFVRALEWADSIGVDIVTASLGYFEWYDYPQIDGNSAVTTIACDIAASRGITVVTSAGNQGGGVIAWPGITPPADGDSVIAVGSVDSLGRASSFGSRGPTYDGRVKPDVMAMGEDVRVASSAVDTLYHGLDGTSFAAPLVAGACALLLEAHPGWGPAEVLNALRSEASNAASPNNTYGWGIIDAYQSAQSGVTGVLASVAVGAARVETGVAVTVTLAGSGSATVDVARRRRATPSTWEPPETIATGLVLSGGMRKTVVDDDVAPGAYAYRAVLATDPSQATPWRSITIPFGLALSQSAPNPFDLSDVAATMIRFSIGGSPAETSLESPPRADVELSIFDVTGALVRTLFSRPLPAGEYQIDWDGSNAQGHPVSSGVYFYRLSTAGRALSRKIVLVRP